MIIIMIYWHPCPNNVKFWHARLNGQPCIPLAQETRRRFNPNLQTKRYWFPSLGRHVTLTVSVKGMKTIDRIGIEAALARIRRNTPDRLELTKLDPVVRKRVTFHETR